MFKRLIEKLSIWFSIRNTKRVATISIVEELKADSKPAEVKEQAWFATANNIIDCFADDGVLNYGTSSIVGVMGHPDEVNDNDFVDPVFQPSLDHINKLRAEWREKNKVLNLEDYLNQQEHDTKKEEVLDSVREGEVCKGATTV